MPILGGGARGQECDTERSSISTNSSAASSNLGSGHWTSASATKLSKFGRRIRESCRNLKVKQGKGSGAGGPGSGPHSPQEYTSLQLPNESVRSKVYVAMDFSGEDGGRVLDNPKDIRSCDKPGAASKDGYVPFRRRIAAPVLDRLTQTQSNIHKSQPWYHPELPRDRANKILQAHANTDGVFLVRESSVAGGYVISYTFSGKHFHSQVIPVSSAEGVVYTVDDGKTKFYDLLQLVEFYQLNSGTLPTRLIHYIVSKSVKEKMESEREREKAPSGVEVDADVDVEVEVEVEGSSCEKMAASSASEGGSAMSQEVGSEEESCNREQQG